MHWGSTLRQGLRVGLSGTSLALAVGCSDGADVSKEAALEPAIEAAAQNVAEEARYQLDRSARNTRRLAEETPQSNARPGEATPWFLRPAGETQQTSSENQPLSQEREPVRSEQLPSVPKPRQPQPPKPVQLNNNRPRGGWGNRAACGRG